MYADEGRRGVLHVEFTGYVVSVKRIHRLVRLITILHGGQAGSTDELAQAMGVSRRTLFRDLQLLKEAGIPHYHEPGKGYRIGQSYYLPPINLTVMETLGLLLLGKTAAAQRHQPLMADALSAVSKLLTSVPDPLRDACSDIMENISVDPGSRVQDSTELAHYVNLQRCIDDHRVCAITYMGPTQTTPLVCKFEPYAMHFAARAWYVLGKTDQHDDVRMFKLVRMQKTAVTDERFDPPKRFTVEDKIGKAWQLIPEGKLYQVELEFTPRVATNVAEVRWHSTQSVRRRKDGSCIVQFEVDGLAEIAWWICGYADQVRVRKPKQLITRVSEMLQQAWQQYSNS